MGERSATGAVDLSRSSSVCSIERSSEDREALGRLAYAEAGNRGEEGLADAVLTRVASRHFGSDVTTVIEASGQFGPVDRVAVIGAIVRALIRAGLTNFNSKTPIAVIGDHAFFGRREPIGLSAQNQVPSTPRLCVTLGFRLNVLMRERQRRRTA